MRLRLFIIAVAGCLTVLQSGPAMARETQLGGIKLGRTIDVVADQYGDPTRIDTITGAAPTQGGMQPEGQQPGLASALGELLGALGPGGTALSNVIGSMGMPGMPAPGPEGAPGMTGMPGEGGMAPAPVYVRQKFAGKIASMTPEAFGSALLVPPAEEVVPLTALAPGGMGPGGMGPGMPGGPEGGMGMQGPGDPTAAQAAAPSLQAWIYEQPKNGATFLFGFGADNRVQLITVGDDRPYSVAKGGRTPCFAGVKTTKNIGLGSSFKDVILAYGFPESTQVLGDEVLLRYFERHGVAFTVRQTIMRVTSITVRAPEE